MDFTMELSLGESPGPGRTVTFAQEDFVCADTATKDRKCLRDAAWSL